MKRPQVSTTGGAMTIFGGFLAVFQDVALTEFLTVFNGLTFGELIGMVIPFVSGLWMIVHNEKSK